MGHIWGVHGRVKSQDVWADTPRMLQLSLFQIAIQQLFDRWSIKNQHHIRLPNGFGANLLARAKQAV